jgi:hypothetical protein
VVLTSRTVAVGALLTATVLVAGCTPAPQSQSAADVVSSLGAVPIPTVSAGVPAPVNASIGHPQLLAMGAPVAVSLPGGMQALITTSGPTEDGQLSPKAPVHGVITVTVTPSAGSVRLSAVDLASRDESGTAVALTPVGPATVTATPGHPATLKVGGTFQQGGAQLNWQQDGHVLAIWDFTIETD